MGGGSSQLVFLLIMVALLVFMFSRTNKQRKAQQEMQNNVGPGAEVMTTSGMFGTVVEVDGDVVVLEIAPGLHTRWTRRAVARVVPAVVAADGPAGSEPPGQAPGGLNLVKPEESPRDDDAPGGATRAH
ncbi:preprotein translocase subunit YajC [Kineococcus sp. SYSU DK006]|uniref:preprotein translocase subunit YajC n=1 Tax=Kineococcus sp. SYSU DK006 TaxID=3383127 RepID=UPI003D7D1AAF